MKAERFDSDFDEGRDVTPAVDLTKARRSRHGQRRVNTDFPAWMIEAREADRPGVTRQSGIRVWLAEGLEDSGLGRGEGS